MKKLCFSFFSFYFLWFPSWELLIQFILYLLSLPCVVPLSHYVGLWNCHSSCFSYCLWFCLWILSFLYIYTFNNLVLAALCDMCKRFVFQNDALLIPSLLFFIFIFYFYFYFYFLFLFCGYFPIPKKTLTSN